MLNTIKIAAITILFCTGCTDNSSKEPIFTIGTGGVSATYYPIGGVIANAISNPPDSRPCKEGGSCGVPNLIASAVSSRGSVDNINAISSGLRNSGFVQSDVTFWAYTGTGTMQDQPPSKNLRAIASLFLEHIHLITLNNSGIDTIADLAGKRVSLDEPGSGTRVDANLILKANNLAADSFIPKALNSSDAIKALINDEIDAFFFVGGYPINSITELAENNSIKLVPIDGEGANTLIDEYGFFSISNIPANTYQGITTSTATVAVGAQWITSDKESEELIYNITKALWNNNTRLLLDNGHIKGRSITLQTALEGISIPLHPGAKKFYLEVGVTQ